MTPSGNESPPARDSFKHILVVRQHDQLGDMLCAVPLLRALRETFPLARIALVTRPLNHDIMLHHPYVDELMKFDKDRFMGGVGHLFLRIRSGAFDLAVVPATVSVSTTSNLIARASGAGVRVGPESLNGRRNPSAWAFTKRVVLDWTADPHRHQAARNLDTLAPLGVTTTDLSHLVALTGEEKRAAREFLAPLRNRSRMLVGFHPGAGKPPNRWPAGNFAALAGEISRKYGAGIVVTKGPMDKEPVAEMLGQLNAPHLLVEDQPIRSVAAIIDNLDLYVTNDTGVLHIAGGTSPRTLALFGPTDPLQWAPIGRKNHFLRSRDGEIGSISVAEAMQVVEGILLDNLSI